MSRELLERWSSTVVLGDGESALIRPITPDDADDLRRFHESQSAESKYLRYFSAKPSLSEGELERFTNVDMVDRAALVVELHGELVAWASYERWPNRDDAEAAFHVDDDQQGKGIATLLLEHLAAIARSNGIDRFTAEVLAENRPMLSVFSRAGWPLQRRFDSGVIDVDFGLDTTSEFIDSVERRERRADSRAVARLLLARSIAVIGASDQPGSVGEAIWKIVRDQTDRRTHPVNPNHDEVGGVRAYRTVGDIEDPVELAIVAVPSPAVVDTVQQCIDARVRGAVLISAVDESEVDLDRLVAHARRNGLRIVGPASMGFASPRLDVGIQAALVQVDLPAGGVAVSMQSGSLGSALLRQAGELQLGLSWFVSLGDKSDVSANDLLQFWSDDDATTVVALYTESLGNPRKFARIARHVSQTRPIVAVRTGAALIGPATSALYQQSGVIEVPTVSAMLDTARVFAGAPPMNGPRVAVISNQRSPSVLAGAALATAGLEPTTHLIPWDAGDGQYAEALDAAMDDDEVDAVLVIHAPPIRDAIAAPVEVVESASDGADKPIVAVLLGDDDGPVRRDSKVQTFAFPERAAAVLGRWWQYWTWRRTEGASELEPPDRIDPEAADEAIGATTADPRVLDGDDTARLLASYGIPFAVGRVVALDDATATADEIGYPVAVKAVQRRAGRSAQAGVALDLGDAEAVVEAAAIMREHLGDDADEVVVQRMVPPGVDLRVQVRTDPAIGPVISVGLGGVQADVIGDEVSRLAPVSTASARSMIEASRSGRALDDDARERAIDLLVRVAQLASDHPTVAHLDLNPVIIGDASCWVTDARVEVRSPERVDGPLRRLD